VPDGTWPRVGVVGPGGVGAYFGGMLARAGARVTMVGRPGPRGPHLRTMAARGLRMRTVGFDELVPVEVTNEPAALAACGLVLFSVKTVDTDAAARTIAPHVSADAVVVDLQNGVDNGERMLRAGLDPVRAVVFVAAEIEQPGTVTHRARGDLVVGHRDRPELAGRAAGWFERAGVPCRISDGIDAELWIKLAVNSGANAISALTAAGYGALVDFEPTLELAEAVVREAVAVARAAGHELDEPAVLAHCRATWRSVGAATSSTRQDLARGRPTEIDALNGFLARRGAELGVATPLNRALSALVRLAERTRDA